jgi:signal transduction histidine kinase
VTDATGNEEPESLPPNLAVLLLEDNELDAELTCASLGLEGGCHIQRVEDQQSFEDALAARQFDLILADYSLPSFDGITALAIAKRVHPEIPFIFVTGALGEELAIETLKGGATDYVLKHRLERLRPSVLRALREKESRLQRELAEKKLRQFADVNARLYEQARRASLAKDEFIAMISHELRTPMTSILGWTRLLKMGALSEEESVTALDAVERSATVQARLIDDLLDISRISTGKLELHLDNIDLAEVVLTTVEALRIPARDKQITLQTRVSGDSCLVRGDRSRLQQVVSNLVQNAVKFTPEAGNVTVELEPAGDRVVLRVIDTGKGIRPDALDEIFEAFRQESVIPGEGHGGLGLGLSIVRHIVERHGGTVSAHSEGQDRGSTFAVTLPLLNAVDAAAGTGARTEVETMPDLRHRTILVVEDDTEARNLIAAILQRCGAAVTTADSVAAAIAVLPDETWDVVVSDIGMPLADGFSLIAHIRQAYVNTPAPSVVAVTAFGAPDDRRRIREAGFARHIVKPIDPLIFARTISALWS